MIGRLDLTVKPCVHCQKTGRDPKNRKRVCPKCNGNKTQFYCITCGGKYGEECVDSWTDQTYCEKKKMQVTKGIEFRKAIDFLLDLSNYCDGQITSLKVQDVETGVMTLYCDIHCMIPLATTNIEVDFVITEDAI